MTTKQYSTPVSFEINEQGTLCWGRLLANIGKFHDDAMGLHLKPGQLTDTLELIKAMVADGEYTTINGFPGRVVRRKHNLPPIDKEQLICLGDWLHTKIAGRLSEHQEDIRRAGRSPGEELNTVIMEVLTLGTNKGLGVTYDRQP